MAGQTIMQESGYTALIRKCVPSGNARYIEAWMRTEHATLDHLSPEAFRELANAAYAATTRVVDDFNERLARSYGL